jgi:hypothetical protein
MQSNAMSLLPLLLLLVLQVTAWIPLLDVNAANGCMQLLAGGHRSGKVAPHTGAVGHTW